MKFMFLSTVILTGFHSALFSIFQAKPKNMGRFWWCVFCAVVQFFIFLWCLWNLLVE